MPDRTVPGHDRFPWKALPPLLAARLRPELDSIAEEMIATIRREVPEYARPMEGRFGAGLRLGVERALHQFVDLIADPEAPQEHNAKIFRDLGHGELTEGRSLDALQAAYRVGARIAWRRYARIARMARLPAELTSTLAEAVFIHIHDLAAESAKGYAEAQASAAGTLQYRRQRLLESLLADPPMATDVLAEFALRAAWPLPTGIACLALDPAEPGDTVEPPTLPDWVLSSPAEDDPYLLVPDPAGRNREALLRHALHGRLAVLGPTVPPVHARRSLHWARRTLRLVRRGAIPRKPLVTCTDHLGDLLLLTDENLARLLDERALAVFTELRPDQRERLEATLLAWLTSKARSAPEVATKLGIHPQTLRYRMHQLTDLLGERLHDPDFRFEAEAALRSRALLSPTPHSA
jgi:hypothetical protein